MPSVSEGLSSSLQLLAPAAAETGREDVMKTVSPRTREAVKQLTEVQSDSLK